MKEKKRLWRVVWFSIVLLFAVPSIYMMQEPVRAEAATPKLSKKKAAIKEGKTTTLTVKKASSVVKWSSSNSKVAKITKKSSSKNSKAVIKGVKSGTAKITAKVGSKKLTCKITVKHVHKYAAATCVRPRTCSCGATTGGPLGHVMMGGSCIERARCMRCFAAGAYGAHVWDTANRICQVCNLMDINSLVKMRITNVGRFTDSVHVYVTNNGGRTFQLSSGSDTVPISATYTANGKSFPVYLYSYDDDDWYVSYRETSNDDLQFAIESYNEDDFFTVSFASQIVFNFSYYNIRTQKFEMFRAVVTPSGSTCTKL